MTKTTSTYERVRVNAHFMCEVRERVCCQCVRAATRARLYAFMIMCVRRLMMVRVCKAVFLCSKVK